MEAEKQQFMAECSAPLMRLAAAQPDCKRVCGKKAHLGDTVGPRRPSGGLAAGNAVLSSRRHRDCSDVLAVCIYDAVRI